MDKVEVAELLKTIVMYYPNFKIDDFDKITNAWLRVLQNKDLYMVLENLAKHVEGNVYPPVLANLLTVPEKRRERYIPTSEEVLLDYAKRDQLLLANKATEEERLNAQAEVKRILNISEVTK